MQKRIEIKEPSLLKPAIIILAAGTSSRLGRPKQLIKNKGLSFIRYFTLEALKFSNTIRVILGAFQESILKEIDDLPIQIILNPDWEEGMASSIRIGLKSLLEAPIKSPLAILMVCDQPFVDANILENLFQEYIKSQKPIIACEYQNTLGTPVLFHESLYFELLKLKGSGGAKKIVNTYIEHVGKISFPLGHFDIDTPEDLKNFDFE